MPRTPARRQLWLEAEHYHIGEVPGIYHPHPEGLPMVGRNCLVVGYPGVGKTMVLKKLCFDLAQNSGILPIYVQIEPWVAKVSAERTFPIGSKQTPRDRELITCTTILLTLAIIERLDKYADYELAQSAATLFPDGLPPRDALSKWIGQKIFLLKTVLEDGLSLPNAYASFPNIFEVVNSIGDAARKQNRTLALLIDQVDKTTAMHFDVIASLLRRGSYVATIATRPCPCAPEIASIPQGLVVGNDYMIHWLGCDARTASWRRFIQAIITNSGFNDSVAQFVLERADVLTSLVGPSARTVLQVCMNIENRVGRGSQFDQAWNEEIISLLEREEATASEVIGAWCGEPRRLITRLRDRAATARTHERLGPGPAIMHIRKHDLFHSGPIDALIRVCTREGFLLPMPRQQCGLDLVVDRYEVSPVLIAPRGQKNFDDRLVEFEVEASDLEKWITKGRRPTVRAPKTVFVPYWMTDPNSDEALPDRLRRRLLGRALVVTGEHAPGSPQWSPAIRDLVKESDLVVVDLTTPRREVFVEWGWAIGAKKQVLLGVYRSSDREAHPAWVQERQLRAFGSDSEFDEFLGQVLRALDSPPDRVSSWVDDPSNEPLGYKPVPQSVVLIGGLGQWDNLRVGIKETASENKFSFEVLDVHTRRSDAGILFDTIRAARKAETLVLTFDSSDCDLLACTAGGIFSMTDSYKMGKHQLQRKLILLQGHGASTLPGLLATKPGVHKPQDVGETVDLLRSHFQQVNGALSAFHSATKRPGGKR